MANRNSSYSMSSMGSFAAHSKQASTQTLLNALHSSYKSSKPYSLESSTSIVVNAWNSTLASDERSSLVVDEQIAQRAWEHARRRAEDGCIVLASLHDSCPSLLTPFISTLPLDVPTIFYTAISAIYPFLQCVTPQNPLLSRHSSLAVTFTCILSGKINNINLKLSTSGLDASKGLLNVPQEPGYRAFDVFYYLLSSAASPAEREALGLGIPSGYALLRKSGTFEPSSYLPTADDAASAEVFRDALKSIGISGSARRELLSTLAGLLKLGDTLGLLISDSEVEQICEEAAALLDVDPDFLIRNFDDRQREVLIAGIYEATVDWVISKANKTLAEELSSRSDRSSTDSSRHAILTPVMSNEDTVSLTVVDIPSPSFGRAVALRTVFDDNTGINAEFRSDGVNVPNAPPTASSEMQSAVASFEPELGMMEGSVGEKRQMELDQREGLLETFGRATEEGSFIRKLLYPVSGEDVGLGRIGRFNLPALLESSRVWFQLCMHPTDELPSGSASTDAWSAASASRQLRSYMLPEWANRRNRQLDFTADFDIDEFCTRFAPLGCKEGRDGIESFIAERGWSNGEVKIGNERVWLRENAWSEAENMLDLLSQQALMASSHEMYGIDDANNSGYLGSPFADNAMVESRENLLLNADQQRPTAFRSISRGDYGLGSKGDDIKGYTQEVDSEMGDPKTIIEQPLSSSRRIWIGIVWALTFWIPSPLLRYIGGMKRPDVRMAWREKVVLCMLIFFFNALVIFYIIEFGRLLCPNYDKVWNTKEVGYHVGDTDFWVSVRGRVYDISKFWRIQHSSIPGVTVTPSLMDPLRGLNLDSLFPIPLYAGCAGLVTNPNLILATNSTTNLNSFTHTYGYITQYPNTTLGNNNWYNQSFMPTMQQYYKGDLVTTRKKINALGVSEQYPWVIINNNVYDFSDYAYTQVIEASSPLFTFLDTDLWNLVTANPGQDITTQYNKWAQTNSTAAELNYNCINNLFYTGKTDIRDTPVCEVQNYILLAFTIMLCAVILVKFLAALQLGSKSRPAPQDKFVICQVPAYTEGEEHLRKGLDSLAELKYDNKRKLICVICDGLVTGGGNDRPTSKIVLDILGVDPKVDPPALPFKSVGAGNEQLNYGKVYSGLYEHDGNVVPYLVVVKTGKESEQSKSKPGNRGKRDSQILLMSFLNRVHHRAPMSPLELEMYHQINNVIGVAPELYEYLFMVDADTMVKEDSLTRLVASCANDAKIVGICGETSLENEDQSWWTMIQVYEYFISHHLSKAFESLFGSVTCLPGCFCMYRLRSADKHKPLIIADAVITDYASSAIDTLHQKNLLSLGEDRYLTTLMMKHFPSYKFKFVPDAQALTAAPETWSILLSQRRRWINSTIHNLAELIWLKDMCGFCLFSMRFVVFIDLMGTVILPATCAYLAYLIYRVASHTGQFPLISIIMIAGVYGLQAIIFIIKRQWQHVGWMIIYILAYPIYSFVLPIFSFWHQDDFSWGQTRVVIGEKGNKQVVALGDEGFDPRSIPLTRWDDYAISNGLPGRRVDAVNGGALDTGYLQQSGFILQNHGFGGEKHYPLANYREVDGAGYEMDEMKSTYSTIRPASTILTGLRSPYGGAGMDHQQQQQMMMMNNGSFYQPGSRPASTMLNMLTPEQQMQQMQLQMQQMQAHLTSTSSRPPSFIPNLGGNRQSTYSSLSLPMSLMSMGQQLPQQQYQDYPTTLSPRHHPQTTTTYSSPATSPHRANPFISTSRPASTFGAASALNLASPYSHSGAQAASSSYFNLNQSQAGFQQHHEQQPSNDEILSAIRGCLAVVDLDTVTKKMLKKMAEARLPVRGAGSAGEGLSEDRRRYMDEMIDRELASM